MQLHILQISSQLLRWTQNVIDKICKLIIVWLPLLESRPIQVNADGVLPLVVGEEVLHILSGFPHIALSPPLVISPRIKSSPHSTPSASHFRSITITEIVESFSLSNDWIWIRNRSPKLKQVHLGTGNHQVFSLVEVNQAIISLVVLPVLRFDGFPNDNC